MNWLLLFCLWVSNAAARIDVFVKVLRTPVYDANQLCAQHHVVLLKKTPFDDNTNQYTDVYAIDFSPDIDIMTWNNICTLLLGQSVPGKIRLVYFNEISDAELCCNPLHTHPAMPLSTIQSIDHDLYNRIAEWDTHFHLYCHNCQHFGQMAASHQQLNLKSRRSNW